MDLTDARHWGVEMTDERAGFVRRLRVQWGYSWRAVARDCHSVWHGQWQPDSNQLAGRAICIAAAEWLGEDPSAEPWN